jgi:hypothetical protein
MLSNSISTKISETAITFIEYIKRFYMNEFSSESNTNTEQQVFNAYEGSELSLNDQSAVYMAYNDNAIISIAKASYLKSRITVRDITGRHSWLISQHRALKGGDVKETDEEVVSSNALDLGADYIKEEKKETELSLKGILDSIEIKDTERLEREIERNEANDTLTKLLKELCNHLEESKNALKRKEAQEIKSKDEAIRKFKDTLLEIEAIEKLLMKIAEEIHKTRRRKELKEEMRGLNVH